MGAATGDDLAVLGDATDDDGGGAVRGRGGELHQDGRVVGALVVDKVPGRGGVVGLHALEGVGEQRAALEVDGALLDRDGALGDAAGPEGVSHGAPGLGEVGAEERLAGLADLEARRGAGDLEVDDGTVVVHALDGVVGAVVGQLDGAVIGVEVVLVVAQLDVVEGRRAPEVGLVLVLAEDLAVELAGGSDAAGSETVVSIICLIDNGEGAYATLL